MNRRNLIIIGVAAVLGLLAVYLANAWFSGVEQRQQNLADQQRTVQIAVATQELEFGAPLNSDNVRLTTWPESSLPQGAITDINEALSGRVAIRPIARGEPILQNRISGRASLSANLPLEMRAISVPVNQITGVAGFVLPGDVVDVFMTRDNITSVLLENVQVLAIDRRTNEQNTDPALVSTATLQVDPISAQKLTLARQVAQLSLALRNVENQEVGPTARVTVNDLNRTGYPSNTSSRPRVARRAPVRRASTPSRPAPPKPEMTIVRGTTGTNYEVQPYGSR